MQSCMVCGGQPRKNPGAPFSQLESSFIDLSIEMQIGDTNNPDIYADKAVDNIKRWSARLSDDGDYNLSIYRPLFEALSVSFNRLTEYLLSYSTILSEKEIAMIVEFRQKDVTKRIRYLYGVENSLKLHQIHDYFREIALLNNDIEMLHKSIIKRIYKQNKL